MKSSSFQFELDRITATLENKCYNDDWRAAFRGPSEVHWSALWYSVIVSCACKAAGKTTTAFLLIQCKILGHPLSAYRKYCKFWRGININPNPDPRVTYEVWTIRLYQYPAACVSSSCMVCYTFCIGLYLCVHSFLTVAVQASSVQRSQDLFLRTTGRGCEGVFVSTIHNVCCHIWWRVEEDWKTHRGETAHQWYGP